MKGEISDFSEIINSTFDNIQKAALENSNKVVSTWKKILEKIHSDLNPNEGNNLISHTRPVDLKNDVLFVEADHPGWIELLNMHKKFIMRGLEYYVPDLKIKNFCCQLKGEKQNFFGKISNVKKPDMNEIESRRIEEINRKFEKKDEKTVNTELPPEILKLFKDMKKDCVDQ